MKETNFKPIFTVRKIANRNPRFSRIYRDMRQKLWRLAVVIFLTIVGVASLFLFGGNFESGNLDARIDPQFLGAAATDFLGTGFEETTGFGEGAKNETITQQADNFKKDGGIGIINSVFYNLKDYFKYVAGSIALLYVIISITQIIVATGDEGVEKGKKNLNWSIIGLIAVFAIDVIVTAFFEGGELDIPGESLFWVDAEGKIVEYTDLFEGIAQYFQYNARIIFSYIKTLAGAFAIIFIFFAGASMISAGGNEEKIEKEKKYLIHAITAFVTLLMLESLIFGFIYPENAEEINDPICVSFMSYVGSESGDTLANFSEKELDVAREKYTDFDARIAKCKTAAELGASGSSQILGIVRFFESLIGGIAIFFIVYSGVSIISSMGNEEQVTKHKKMIFWSLAGLAVILLADSLVNKFLFVVDSDTGAATVNVAQGIADLAGVTNFIATFVGVFSVISIIVAGMIWVANFGNTEIAEKSKKVILAAVIGVVLSISAYAIINSITAGNPEGKGDGISVEVSI